MPVIDQTQSVARPFFPVDSQSAPATAQSAASPETVTVTAKSDPRDDSGRSFFDNLLDIVNPLEHLPIVSTIYDKITGREPGYFEQAAGDMLYGGPVGFLSSVGNLVFENVTGKSVGDTVLGWFTGGDHDAASSIPSTPSTPTLSAPGASTPSVSSKSATGAKPSDDPYALFRKNSASVPAASDAAPKDVPTAEAASVASAPPRLLNPLPLRGAPPAIHTAPSETKRAAGMAQMIANRAHLKTPASETAAPANTTPVQPTADSKQVADTASQKSKTVPIDVNGIPTLDDSSEQALLTALNQSGVSGDLSQRALFAYQKTMAMNPDAANAAALQSAATLH